MPDRSSSRPASRSDVLVEREHELEVLGASVDAAAGGDGRVVWIEGPAGIGKSRLPAELRARAERGAGVLVLAARGSELERAFAFGVVHQLFEARLADPGTRDRIQMGGALGREAPGAGARATMDGSFCLFGVGVPMSPAQADALDARLTELLAVMRPWATGSFYVNFAERGGSMETAFSAADYARLQAVRRAWDPGEALVPSHRIATR